MGDPVLIGGAGVTIEPVDSSGNGTVVPLDDLGSGEADLVREVIEVNGTATRIEADVPENVSAGDVVRYRGEHYRITRMEDGELRFLVMRAERLP